MYDFVNSSLGWFHLITALLAMVAGAFVLIIRHYAKPQRVIGHFKKHLYETRK